MKRNPFSSFFFFYSRVVSVSQCLAVANMASTMSIVEIVETSLASIRERALPSLDRIGHFGGLYDN